MKKILILLILAGNMCQPAYGFSLNSVNSLFSTIKDSISSYSSPLLETLNEHKIVGYGLAIAVAATFVYKATHAQKDKANAVEKDKAVEKIKAKAVEKIKKIVEKQIIETDQNIKNLKKENEESTKKSLIHTITFKEQLSDQDKESVKKTIHTFPDFHNTLIQTAIRCNKNTDILNYLIKDLNFNCKSIINDQKENMLHHAAKFTASKDIVDYLLSLDIDLNAQNNERLTPLHIAIINDNLDFIIPNQNKYLVEALIEKKVALDVKDKQDLTPLDYAKRHNNQTMITILNNAYNKFKRSPIAYVIMYEDLPILQLLKSALNDKNFSIETAMKYKKKANVSKHFLKFVDYLLSFNDINSVLEDKDFLIKTAINYNNKADTLKYLIEKLNFNHKAINDQQENLLHYAAKLGASNEVVDYLLSFNDIDLNAQNTEGLTPLHIASINMNQYLVEALIKKNVALDVKNRKGLTPLDYAKKHNNQTMIKILTNTAAPEKKSIKKVKNRKP